MSEQARSPSPPPPLSLSVLVWGEELEAGHFLQIYSVLEKVMLGVCLRWETFGFFREPRGKMPGRG